MADATDHIRRLADLFLTRRDDAPTAAATATAERPASDQHPEQPVECEAFIECVLVGHLPVRAGLWLTQYADDVAAEHGPTGLIRLDADQYILEVLRGSQAVARASTAETLDEAVQATARDVHRWVVRPNLATGVDALLRAGPDVVTILSGADEIAIVAAYRAIKDIHETARANGLATPNIEMAVLGADRAKAEAAVKKVAATARDSIGIEVQAGRAVQAMGPLGSTLHFRFAADADHALSDMFESIRHVNPEPRIEDPRPILTLANMHDEDVIEDEDSMNHSLSETAEETETHVMPAHFATPVDAGPVAPSPAARPAPPQQPEPVKMRPKPAVHVEPKRMVPHPKPNRAAPVPTALSTWVNGLAKLPVKCPDAEGIELAVDTRGELHIVGWVDQIRLLSVASAWTTRHRELICMACGSHNIKEAGDITVHVFTPDPARVCDLYGSGAKLHVLAPVEVEGKKGWYAAPLNP